MSIVIRRDHPAGAVGLSVAAFPEDDNVVLGIGPLKDMKFFSMSADEADEVDNALYEAIQAVITYEA